ncbi:MULTISPECIES: flagellar protein FliT [Pseudomonas]|uniref:flagellar protein FliT n=1 Tax=Pseudomonas TaxID=286 RepID=UPI00224AB566|nr:MULTISPECIES: flagellar protein FliT [unclassified Pseudomonas]MCX2887331.1 flagellar protein FliT [Pseudomonas sp. DCB_BI]MDH4553518.1 flagellar protein FliT [Pseudomonas sp. BN607]
MSQNDGGADTQVSGASAQVGAEGAISVSQRVNASRVALADALAREDWEAVSVLDIECRACVEAVLSEPSLDRAQVQADLEALLEIYRSLVADASQARQAIAREVSEFRKSASQAKIYNLFSSPGA